jgi:sugar O-acyltransferase (sialic acid O-acetyltransferase NeuD family)
MRGATMAKLVIFGTGPIAKLANYYFTRDSEHEVVAFTVDASHRDGSTFEGLPLVDFELVTDLFPPQDFKMFIAVSYAKLNQVRAAKYFRAKEFGYDLVSYVSSRCTYLSDEPVGDNCFILEDNTIQPFVKIGNNVTLWSGNHIGHDAVIEDHCFIASHVVISGFVRVQPYCFIGVNASLRQAITVAPHTLIGGGAVIMKDTVESGVYVPPRAELIQKKSHEIKL